ncbi:hypothetical protein PF003_g37932 [Phytophthora fragariae]|nr:hypothetical protein PF003_g37932 [Phytophthora fragariae]
MLEELRRRAPARGRASDRDRARATWSRWSSESSKTASGPTESAGEEPGVSAWDDSSSEASKIASESSETIGDLGVGVAEVVCGSTPALLGSPTGEEDSGPPLVGGAAAGPAPDPSKPTTGERGWGLIEPGVVAEEWSSDPVRSDPGFPQIQPDPLGQDRRGKMEYPLRHWNASIPPLTRPH